MEPINTPPPKDYEDDIRDLLRDESELIHHRMSWFGTFQGFLFAGMGFSWKMPENSPAVLICILGFVVAALTFNALLSASFGIRNRLIWWEEHKPEHWNGPPMLGHGPKDPKSFRHLGAGWNFIPIALAIVWLTLFIIRVSFYRH